MLELIRFVLSALFTLAGLFVLVSGVVGVFRFRYSMNRMHAAALGDTLGILCEMCIRDRSHGEPADHGL